MCIRKHPYLSELTTTWDSLLDALEQDILTCPDEELLLRAKEEGRDPAETSRRVKGVLRSAIEENH